MSYETCFERDDDYDDLDAQAAAFGLESWHDLHAWYVSGIYPEKPKPEPKRKRVSYYDGFREQQAKIEKG